MRFSPTALWIDIKVARYRYIFFTVHSQLSIFGDSGKVYCAIRGWIQTELRPRSRGARTWVVRQYVHLLPRFVIYFEDFLSSCTSHHAEISLRIVRGSRLEYFSSGQTNKKRDVIYSMQCVDFFQCRKNSIDKSRQFCCIHFELTGFCSIALFKANTSIVTTNGLITTFITTFRCYSCFLEESPFVAECCFSVDIMFLYKLLFVGNVLDNATTRGDKSCSMLFQRRRSLRI